MDDDFNTPEAIAVLQTTDARDQHGEGRGQRAQGCRPGAELRSLAGVLGITVTPKEWFSRGAKLVSQGGHKVAEGSTTLADAEIGQRIEARMAARKARNWAESDRIREELAAAGVILEDKPGGKTEWRRA